MPLRDTPSPTLAGVDLDPSQIRSAWVFPNGGDALIDDGGPGDGVGYPTVRRTRQWLDRRRCPLGCSNSHSFTNLRSALRQAAFDVV